MATMCPHCHDIIHEDPTSAEGWMHRMDPTGKAFLVGNVIGAVIATLGIIVALVGKYCGWWLLLPFPQLH